jgi:hypothetical protein
MAAIMDMRDRAPSSRAVEMGPIRREIVFEPFPERPAPIERPGAPPDQQPKGGRERRAAKAEADPVRFLMNPVRHAVPAPRGSPKLSEPSQQHVREEAGS